MIDNYLDFVKGWRKFYLCEGISDGRKRRDRTSSYLKGFESGYALAAIGAARQFKRLQKDIEARILAGGDVIGIEHFKYGEYKEISLTGGTNVK